VKSYASALVGVIIKAILQNARCNNKDRRFFVREEKKKQTKALTNYHNRAASFLINQPTHPELQKKFPRFYGS